VRWDKCAKLAAFPMHLVAARPLRILSRALASAAQPLILFETLLRSLR